MEKIRFKNNTLNTVIVPKAFDLTGYMIEAIYVNNKGVANCPCAGGHSCDNARFNIFINDVLVLEANLNNFSSNADGSETPDHPIAPVPKLMSDGIGSDPLDRYSASILGTTVAKQIATNDPNNYTVNILPHPTNTKPHGNITWVRIKDPDENIVYSSCSAAGQAVSVTKNILENLSAIKRLQCLDMVTLEFNMTDMELGSEYSIKYQVLDSQSLSTIPLNQKTYKFHNPCCTTRYTTEYLNGFTITPVSKNLSCQVMMDLICTQSALIEISLLKNNTTISKDIAQILCPTCKLDAVNVGPLTFNPIVQNINDQFEINFTNLSVFGTAISSSFGNTAETPVVLQNTTSYVDIPISLIATNLTVNGFYEYKLHILPNDAPITIEPISGRFFAGETQQTVSTMFNMTNNQISIIYASLKDIETGIIKHTRLVYIVNTNNCTEMKKNYAIVEYPQNVSTESGLELGEDCDLTKLLQACLLQQ
jgi:hypothetical protein